MTNDDRSTVPPKINTFWFFDLESDKDYNMVDPNERIRLRDDLQEKGFFDNPEWKPMYEWFSNPLFTVGMFNKFLQAIRFYNRILHHKKNNPNIDAD